jgi:hypothetical protein
MNYHQQTIQDSIEELSDLVRQRRKLDKRIARLQKMVGWDAVQLSENIPPSAPSSGAFPAQPAPIGFTEAIRRVLSSYKMWLSPVLVRDLLPMVGFDIERYKEPLPSIHVILGRLVSSGEALQSKHVSGNAMYIWADGSEKTKTRTAPLITELPPPQPSYRS